MQFYDVAGQKEKRQRWVPYMQSRLSAIIYVTSIASYDQRMEEDRTVNRYVDALVLFESIMQNPLLKGVQTIVMLNKVDIFEEKIKVVDFKTHIHHYNGKNTSKDVIKFISEEFKRKNQEVQRKVIVHLTTGTDIKLMKGIIKSIQYISFTQENHPKSSA